MPLKKGQDYCASHCVGEKGSQSERNLRTFWCASKRGEGICNISVDGDTQKFQTKADSCYQFKSNHDKNMDFIIIWS